MSVAAAIICLITIVIDLLAGNEQHMMIMNFVWPLTALYAGPLGCLYIIRLAENQLQKCMGKKIIPCLKNLSGKALQLAHCIAEAGVRWVICLLKHFTGLKQVILFFGL